MHELRHAWQVQKSWIPSASSDELSSAKMVLFREMAPWDQAFSFPVIKPKRSSAKLLFVVSDSFYSRKGLRVRWVRTCSADRKPLFNYVTMK